MSVAPEITERAAQPYVAIRAQVTMQGLGDLADRLGSVFGWLAARGLEPAGAPFFRYNVIDMERELVEAGVPVEAGADGDDQVLSGVLPGGRYATLTHVGPYDGLAAATADLLHWAGEHGIRWDMAAGDDGERWGARLEIYLTDPGSQPDPSTWATQLAFRLAD